MICCVTAAFAPCDKLLISAHSLLKVNSDESKLLPLSADWNIGSVITTGLKHCTFVSFLMKD